MGNKVSKLPLPIPLCEGYSLNLKKRDKINLTYTLLLQKAQQMMHQKLLEITKENVYDNEKMCSVINIGSVFCDFFNVYEQFEPDALPSRELVTPLLMDLNKGNFFTY